MIPMVTRAATGARSLLFGSRARTATTGLLGLELADEAGVPVWESIGDSVGSLFGSAGESTVSELLDDPVAFGGIVLVILGIAWVISR